MKVLRLLSVDSKLTKFLNSFSKAQVSSSLNFALFITQSSTPKFKFSDLLLLTFTIFLMSFLEPRVSFSSNYASHFFICFGQKEPIKVQILSFSTASMKISQIPFVSFQDISQFSFQFCITFQCHDLSVS